MAIGRRFRDIVRNRSVRTAVRLSGPFASPRLVGRVRSAAKGWNPETGFTGSVEGLDDAGYDHALDASGPFLSDTCGEDLVAFVSDIKLEAMRASREAGPRGRFASAAMFAIPFEGDPEAVALAASDPECLDALARSLVLEGVAAPGSRVVFLPGCLTPAQMLLALPGRIRRCLNLVLDAAVGGPLPAGVASAALSLLTEPPTNDPGVPEAVGELSARVLVGVRIVEADADGDVPLDYFTTFMPESVARDFLAMESGNPALAVVGEGAWDNDPDPTVEAPELDAWVSEANAAFGTMGLTFALPDHWARATAMMGCMHLQRGLARALAAAGGDLGDIDSIMVHRGDETVSLGATAGGRLVGPVHVPRCLLSQDPAQLDIALSAYEAPVDFHEGEDPFPSIAA
jgi:hypothetical protein